MKKIIRLTESDLINLVKRVINESKGQSNFKVGQTFDEIHNRQYIMALGYKAAAIGLRDLYNDFEFSRPKVIAVDNKGITLKISSGFYYPNDTYKPTQKAVRLNDFCLNIPYSSIQEIRSNQLMVSIDNSNIGNHIDKDCNNEKKTLKNCDTFPIKFGCQNQKLIPFQKCLNAKETGVFDDQTYSKIIDYFVGRMEKTTIHGGHVVMANKLKFDGLDNEFYTKIINNCKKTNITPTINQVKDCKNRLSFKVGMKGESIKKVQGLLGTNYANILGVNNKQQYDGVFGPKTEKAVRQFQMDNNLTPDGVVGCKTIGKMLEILRSSVKPTETPNKPISPDATLGDQSNMVTF
jgi:hypothetical protein